MTQCDAILDYIKSHGEITQFEALREIGCMRLASRISDLKMMGYPIEREMRSRKNYKGEVKHFAAYRLGRNQNEIKL